MKSKHGDRLTQPAWVVASSHASPVSVGGLVRNNEWFDSEGEAREFILRLAQAYGQFSYSLRRFDAGESRTGEGTLLEQGGQ